MILKMSTLNHNHQSIKSKLKGFYLQLCSAFFINYNGELILYFSSYLFK